MPWTDNDAEKHTHKATTPALKQLWAKVANESLDRTGDEGRAIREANAVIARQAEALGTWGFPHLLEEAVKASASSEQEVKVRLRAKNLLFGFENFHVLELAPGNRSESGPT